MRTAFNISWRHNRFGLRSGTFVIAHLVTKLGLAKAGTTGDRAPRGFNPGGRSPPDPPQRLRAQSFQRPEGK
jgi:hypothetical protein